MLRCRPLAPIMSSAYMRKLTRVFTRCSILCNLLSFNSALYFTHLQSNMLVTYMLFFGYMGVICLGIFMLCGSIGFYSCLWFTKRIYASIKVD